MKLKIILKSLTFKLFVKLLCSLCLMYQTYILSEKYLKYKSIINIKFTKNKIEKLPAITICYNNIISFQKLVKRYPEHEGIYENYAKFILEFSRFNSTNEDIISERNQFYLLKYNQLLQQHNLSILDRIKLNYLEIFDNLSITFFNGIRPCIYITIYGDKGGIKSVEGYYVNHIYSLPIESIDLRRASKCFTYFYEKEITYLNKTINIVGIRIEWYFHYTWFPFSEFNTISFAIHPQNVKPAQNIYRKFEQTSHNMVIFSKVEEKRLTYYDNCREYNKSHNDFNSRIDCLEDCFFKVNSHSYHDQMRSNSQYFLFRHQLSNSTYMENRECQREKTYIELVNYCNNKCEEDCYQVHY